VFKLVLETRYVSSFLSFFPFRLLLSSRANHYTGSGCWRWPTGPSRHHLFTHCGIIKTWFIVQDWLGLFLNVLQGVWKDAAADTCWGLNYLVLRDVCCCKWICIRLKAKVLNYLLFKDLCFYVWEWMAHLLLFPRRSIQPDLTISSSWFSQTQPQAVW